MTKNDHPPLEEEGILNEKEEISELSKDEVLQAEVSNLKEQLLRALAEHENYRKRAEREREEMAKFAITGFSRELLTVSDNLRRALESIPEDHENPEKLLESLLQGVEITEKELLSIFKKHGIEKIDPLGQPFDHHFHQAMFEHEDEDQAPGTILHVLQTGYTLNGRLLRPALVGVAKKKSEGDALKPDESVPT